MLLALLVHLAVQDPVGEPPPELEAPPVVPLAPPTESPPPPPPPPPPPKPDRKPTMDGIDQPALGFLQVAAGSGACCAGCCVAIVPAFGLGLIPVVGTALAGVAADVIIGTTIGVTEVWVGDAFGNDRAALLWPVASSVGVLLFSTTVTTVANLVEPAPVPTPDDVRDLASLQEFYRRNPPGPLQTTAQVVGVGACIGSVVLPAVVYAAMSVPKKPGDLGQGFPGIMEPSDPIGSTVVARAEPATTAMRY